MSKRPAGHRVFAGGRRVPGVAPKEAPLQRSAERRRGRGSSLPVSEPSSPQRGCRPTALATPVHTHAWRCAAAATDGCARLLRCSPLRSQVVFLSKVTGNAWRGCSGRLLWRCCRGFGCVPLGLPTVQVEFDPSIRVNCEGPGLAPEHCALRTAVRASGGGCDCWGPFSERPQEGGFKKNPGSPNHAPGMFLGLGSSAGKQR